MQKLIITGKEARQQVKNGIDKVCDAVKVTLGITGRNVLVKRSQISTQGFGIQHAPTFSTKDGVTVIKHLTLTDALENMGADFVKDAADKTMDEAGDSTTTTAVLLQAFVEQGSKMIDDGYNPMELKKGVESAVEYVVEELKKLSVPVGNDFNKIRQVATVSANNDHAIGILIADAIKEIGTDGIIEMERAKGSKTEIKTDKGVKFNKGFISPYFANNDKLDKCEFENPFIILYDKRISQESQIHNLMLESKTQNRPLLVICDDCDGEALATFIANRSTHPACVVCSPEFGEAKREAMEDLAVLVGATFVSDEKGNGLKTLKVSEYGKALKVVVTKNSTTIIGGIPNGKKLEDLLNNLEMDKVEAEGEEKLVIEKRIAKLKGGVAVLYVGAKTEMEFNEKWDRIDDSVRATKCAILEGFIPGGGTAFLRIKPKKVDIELQKGYDLVFEVLKTPLIQILKNSGIDKYEKLLEQVLSEKQNIGYNAKTNFVEDLVKAGVIDATKSLRAALEHSASAACGFFITETVICDSL